MKVKMTRTERAVRKAQKAAKVAYKLGKAPTLYEFTNPVDLMTKEEKFQWELEKYFEDIKGTQYYDEVMSTCEWLLNDEDTWVSESTTGRQLAQWVFDEHYRGAACKTVAGIPEYKDRIRYTREVAQMMGLSSLAWLSQLKGNIDWSKGSTYKKAIMAAIERVLGLKDTNGTLWGCPSALKVPAFFESIGHKEATPYAYETHTVENAQGWVIKPIAKDSIDNLIIGDLTGCCQKLGGWGEHVCIDGWGDEHNINYGIYSPNGNLRAHFWTYIDKSGRLVVDSIEGAVLLEDDTKLIGFELISRWIGSSKYPVLVSETCYGITDTFCDWMANFTGTMTSVKNHEPKGFYRYLDNKHEKAFFFPSYFCQTVPVAHDEKWCYDHDEYLKKARAVRGPVNEPCDPYEWDDEYNEYDDF